MLLFYTSLEAYTNFGIVLGGTTKEKLLQYVRESLTPELRSEDIVVMDNLSAHHAPQIAEMIYQT